MGLEKFIKDISGETKRREIKAEIDDVYNRGKLSIIKLVNNFNNVIKNFNNKVDYLNNIRFNRVKSNIDNLGVFLSTFGNVKEVAQYSQEKTKLFLNIPEKEFEEVEEYIEKISLTKEQIFRRAFFRTPLVDMILSKKENLEMKEKLEYLKNNIMKTQNKLRNKISMLKKVDLRICNIYVKLTTDICNCIENRILPEIELINCFLECESIKNIYISNTTVKELSNVEYQKDIMIYNNTIYQKHYNFIRNAFWFYILSSTIYSSPILTKLCERKKISDDDIKNLESQKKLCAIQIKALKNNSI